MSKTAFLFPGQGAQVVGMGRQLVEDLPEARDLFDCAERILGYDLADLCFNGPEEKLNSTVHSQPALYVASLAAMEQLRRDQPEAISSCAGLAGLSLGEYTALVVAGVIEFEAGLSVVQRRGEAMQAASDAVPSGMLSILGLELSQVEGICQRARGGEVLEISNLLCPGNIVISGSQAACSRAASMAVSLGAMKVVPLSVAGAFHTSIMEPAVSRLSEALAQVEMKPARIPIVSNVDAAYHTDPQEIRQLLIRQIISPVRWEDSMGRFLEDGCDKFFEIGPGRVLRGLLRRIERKVSCENVSL